MSTTATIAKQEKVAEKQQITKKKNIKNRNVGEEQLQEQDM